MVGDREKGRYFVCWTMCILGCSCYSFLLFRFILTYSIFSCSFFSAIAYMDSKWINSDERRGSEKENISTAPPLSEDSLPLFLKQKLEKIRNRSSASSHSVSSYEGFGSFHSENVEVLIGQSNEIYTPPVIPLVARRVLKKDKVDALNAYTSKDEEMLEAEMGRLVERPTKKCEFGETFRKEYFIITQDMVFINHGGFGSALYGAMFMKHQLEKRMEHEVVEFVDREVLPLVVYSVRRVSDFIHSNPWDVVLVQNATFAMNSAIKLIESSDVVAYFDTEYLAVYKIMWYHCKKVGAPFFELPLNQFIHDEEIMGNDEKLAAHICSLLPEGCTTLIMDHVTSTSALCFPVFSHIIPAVRKCGVKKIIVDGAHAPLQVDLNFNDLPELSKPTVYLGNFHKWMSSPKGAGFLWADRKAVPSGFSAVLSHGAGDGFLSEFIWDGTKDYGAYLTLPAIIDFWTTQNLSRVREYCSTLLQDAVKMLTNAFESRRVARHSPFMALVELPNKLQERRASAKYIQDMLHDEFSIEVPIKHIEGRFYVRISAFVYNTLAEYVYLKEAVLIIADWCDSSSRAIEMK